MNKTLKIILVCSLAANAIWAIGAISGYFSSAKLSSKNTSSIVSGKTAAKSADGLSPEAAKELKTLLTEADPVTLRDRLTALGLPKEQVRKLVTDRIMSRYNEKSREIDKAKGDRPYWQQWYVSAEERERMNSQWRELQTLLRVARDEIYKVLGSDENNIFDPHLRTAFLPPEKAAQLNAIDHDYNDMRTQLFDEMSGFSMPGDKERLKVLEDEKQRDMLALMTPEEREMNDLRNSQSAQTVQSRFGARFKLSEDEYKAIYAMQKSIDETYDKSRAEDGVGRISDPETWARMIQGRVKAEEEMVAQVKDMVGSERWEEYLRYQRSDYDMLQAAARRFNFSDDTVAQTYQTRTNAANEAKRISDDTTLSEAQKTAAYSELSARAINQIRASLGDDVGNAYIDRALPWLKKLPAGGRINVDERGNVFLSSPRAQE